jgi:hypothetical protein
MLYNCDRVGTKGTEECYRTNYNYKHIAVIHGRSHVTATVRNSEKHESSERK